MTYFVCPLIDSFKISIGYVDFEFKTSEKLSFNGKEKSHSLKGTNMWYNIYPGIGLWKILFQKHLNFYITLFFTVKIITQGLRNG